MDQPLTVLRQFIVNHYHLEELRTLCFDLGIEYENLGGGETRNAKARELVLWAGKRGQFDRLLPALGKTRPEPFEQAGLSAEASVLEALYADLAAFEDRTKPPQRKILDRISLGQRVGFAFLAVLIVAVSFALYSTLRPRSPGRMSGDFRIAVAGFAEKGKTSDSQTGREIAQDVFLRLQQAFDELDLGFTVTIWGPEQVGLVGGQTEEARANSAAETAAKIGADIVIYGWVDTAGTAWQVTPEFYVSEASFIEAREITGPHDMGAPFSVPGRGGIASRIQVSDEFTTRAQVLSKIVVGLSFHAVHDYETALTVLQSAEEIEGWQDDMGRRVLCLLIGNAAAKAGYIKLAQTYHQRALELDDEYARAYVGLAGVYYLLAQEQYMDTDNPAHIDRDLLGLAATSYQQALEAPDQPSGASISAKVHLGLGQCYLMRFHSGEEAFFPLAIAELATVVEAYGDGANAGIRDLAAEAHGRLGVLYELSGDDGAAVESYQRAASLLENDPERHAIFQERGAVLAKGAPLPALDSSLVGEDRALYSQDVSAEAFSTQRTPPEDVLQEISFYYVEAEAPPDCKYPDLKEPRTYTHPEVLNARSTSKTEVWGEKRVTTCGWQRGESVDVTIAYPDGSLTSQQVSAQPDVPDYYAVSIRHFTELGDPPGAYVFTFAGESGQVSHTVDFVLPAKPRVYKRDDKQLLLYNFAPNERVRLFAYTPKEEGKAALVAWDEFTVDSSGRLVVELRGIGTTAWWVALGDVSGEVTVFGAGRRGGPGSIRE